MLGEMGFTNFEGLDASDEAVRWCTDKRLGKVWKGDVCNIPFPDSTFDLVLATDIIEHVSEDARAVAEIRRVLKPGSRTIITVPAFRALWGLQDMVAHHKRRYRRREVLALLSESGLVRDTSFYFNYLLFVPILMARLIIRLLRLRLQSENQLNNSLINALLSKIFALDVRLAPVLRAPFGVSFLVVAHRQEDFGD
jgi:SAM-dependent methyltransferase